MTSTVERHWPGRVIRCWACDDLLALAGHVGRLIVEADAEMTTTGGRPVIVCPCGARTMLLEDWESDMR